MGTYPELIDHQVRNIFVELVQQRTGLLVRKVLEAPLKDPAAIRMRREFVHAPTEGRDEPETLRDHMLDDLLNNL